MNYKTQGEVYKQDNLTIINDDCMNILKQTPDNYYDLCLVDPPYGIGFDGENQSMSCGKRKDGSYRNMKSWSSAKAKGYKNKKWDSVRPPKAYFTELMRVSRFQIIWGGNYFADLIPPSGGWVVWEKGVPEGMSLSQCELAWTNKLNSIKLTKHLWAGYKKCESANRIHPTQKPVKLYNWIYQNYAEPGQKILDSHLGSGSNAIAAHYAKMGEFVGVELDKDYFQASVERIRKETRQLELF